MSKCIKCGRELTSAEIPEFYNGMCEKCSKELNCAEYPFKQGINDYQKQIDQLKQQNEELMLQLSKYEIEKHKPAYCTLAGTECEYLGNVDELKQQLDESFTEEDVEGLIEDRDKTIKFLQQQLAEKDTRIAELEDKDWYEACIKQLEEQNNRLIDTLKEKDKEIETMKKDSDKNIDYLVEFASLIENEKDCNRVLKALDRVKSGNKYIIDKVNQSKTEFVIQELEKVKDTLKHFCNIHNDEFYGVKSQVKGIEQNVCESIDNQIKELKGEKNDNRWS